MIPKKAAPASYAAVALAVALLALGAVVVRDALLAAGLVTGAAWAPAAVRAADGLTPAGWTVAAGALATVGGLALLVAAVAPRRPRGVPLHATTAVYVELDDVARLATAAAERIPGVVSARSTAARRTVTVRCRVIGPVDRRLVADDVTTALRGLAAAPRIRVHTTMEDRS